MCHYVFRFVLAIRSVLIRLDHTVANVKMVSKNKMDTMKKFVWMRMSALTFPDCVSNGVSIIGDHIDVPVKRDSD